jgi:hypothetical protein
MQFQHKLSLNMGGFMESFFWRQNLTTQAVKLSTCFAQKHMFNIDINPLDFLIVYKTV